MDQQQTPVFDGLMSYVAKQRISFHIPGHKDGNIFPQRARKIYQSLLKIDATEVADLDDLYRPTGILREGEDLLRDYYGTRSSYFLVSGSTGGNLAMILSCIRRGERVLVQRDSHQSVFNALKLVGADPVFLAPAIDSRTGFSYGADTRSLAQALKCFPNAQALILTYPNYYGMAAASIEILIRMAHRSGLLVLVDEAHGPHFHLGAPMPPSTLDLGADLVVHSAHKMLPAMTMGAYLHLNSPRVAPERVAEARAMVQTSSPSYPIMASLDLARYFLAEFSKEQVFTYRRAWDSFAETLDRLDELRVLRADPGRFLLDPFKLTISLKAEESGFEWQRKLIRLGIYPEMAGPHHVLFTLGMADPPEAVPEITDRISASLSGFHLKTGQNPPANTASLFPSCSRLALSYEELKGLDHKPADLARSVGEIAAETVLPYPPGVPLILQGERITTETVQHVHRLLRSGAFFHNMTIKEDKIMIYRSGAART